MHILYRIGRAAAWAVRHRPLRNAPNGPTARLREPKASGGLRPRPAQSSVMLISGQGQ